MLKRTKSFALLLLLVITGLASGVATTTLTNKERALAITHLKESKEALQKSVKGLSAAQLSFKPTPDAWSIQECLAHIALSEEEIWKLVSTTLQQAANPQKRAGIKTTDDQLLAMMADRDQKGQASETLQPARAPWSTPESILKHFKEQRQKYIKYLRTSTEDFRSHVTQLPFGALDAYQLVLLLSGHTARHTAQIADIKKHPAYPKQ
jgi:hypothetical protein